MKWFAANEAAVVQYIRHFGEARLAERMHISWEEGVTRIPAAKAARGHHFVQLQRSKKVAQWVSAAHLGAEKAHADLHAFSYLRMSQKICVPSTTRTLPTLR